LVGKLIERDALSSATAGVDSSVKQILQLFRGAEYIADTAELTMKLLEAMNLVKMETQRELIQLLPEVAADSEHKIVVAELTALLSANSDLVGSIMQALANLQITDQRTQTELLNAVAERLASADIEDIPAMLHFLFQTIPKSEMSVYLNQLRANLDVDSLAQLVNNAKCPQKGKQNTLVMDALRISLYINRTAIDSWIKLLDAAPPAAIKTLDIIALLIIHASDTSTRRKIYRIVKSKLPQGF
jgi:hypothetical protein